MINEKKCPKCAQTRDLSLFAIYDGKPHCWCKLCQRESAKAYRLANLEKCKAAEKIRREKTRDKHMANCRAWRLKNAEHVREMGRARYQRDKAAFVTINRKKNLQKNYGITIEQYDAMYRAQNGVCAVCSGMNISGRRLAVDHNHATGKIRELLCGKCNTTLGTANESIEILKKLIYYLEKHETLASIGAL